ncbi:uncharacterized protein isoform X6 [Choristoneura fumiferana]|uniref:uncharacterized protein isoform X6 n=1 Tax=Choristoneura fumiferana TaxID=7141 RepID=UPI003D1570DE
MASTTVKEENCSDDLLACRICLASDVKLFHIRRWGIEQVFVDLMGTPLSVCDGFPQHVCVWCRALLLRARELRARCQRAEHLLKDALIHQHYARGNECRLCRKRFFRPAGLRDHMRDNHQLKYHCLRCDETINSKYSAEMHAQFHAGKVFQCEHCGQQFRPSCRTCGAARASCALSRQPPSTGIAARSPPASVNNTHSSCTQCGEVCANEQDLLTHRMEQHGLQLFTCDMCNKTFESKESVATHIDRVHRLMKPVQRRPGHRPPPARRPNKQQDAVCEVCGKRSTCMATLKIHMNTHTGARPYKCSLCPKTYVTPHGLKTHEPVHSGARKWSCEECHATFMRQSSLSLHRRAVHSGERAYQCHICCKTFTQSGSLYTHVKYVHMKVKPPPRKRNKKTAT